MLKLEGYFSLFIVLIQFFGCQNVTGSYAPNILIRIPYWRNSHCDKDAIMRNLSRVCVVYKRNAPLYYYPSSTIGSEEQGLDQASRHFGPYHGQYRPWENSMEFVRLPQSLGYPLDFSYPALNTGTYIRYPPVSSAYPFFPPSYPPFPIFPYPGPPLQIIPNRFLPIQPPPRRPLLHDSFKRWRRQSRLYALVVKCCFTGCTPHDFLEVDKEFNICNK